MDIFHRDNRKLLHRLREVAKRVHQQQTGMRCSTYDADRLISAWGQENAEQMLEQAITGMARDQARKLLG